MCFLHIHALVVGFLLYSLLQSDGLVVYGCYTYKELGAIFKSLSKSSLKILYLNTAACDIIVLYESYNILSNSKHTHVSYKSFS